MDAWDFPIGHSPPQSRWPDEQAETQATKNGLAILGIPYFPRFPESAREILDAFAALQEAHELKSEAVLIRGVFGPLAAILPSQFVEGRYQRFQIGGEKILIDHNTWFQGLDYDTTPHNPPKTNPDSPPIGAQPRSSKGIISDV